MTETRAPGYSDREESMASTWANPPGWGALAAVNHGTIGLRFIVTGFCFFLVGGLLAMLMRAQLARPQQAIIDADLYSQVFTMHGTVMMFLFAIPILEGLAMYLIPKMIGARDLLFPRLSAFGYYCYLFGGLIVLSSIFLGMAPESGWFMYTPLSSAEYSPGLGSDFWLLGITFVEISAVSAGAELVVSILRSRTQGMSLRVMPLFCWYILVVALMIIFGFPPLILASILLELERSAGWVFFDIAGGGDALLWQHLFWIFGHPEVYIIFLPGAAIISTLVPVFAGRPLLGHRWVVVAVLLIGFNSFGLWVHHMYAVGIPQLAQSFFSVASMLVAIPTGIQIFAWLGTLWAGRVVHSLPMLWVFGFLVIFVAGGLTGVMVALVPFDLQVHDSHFVVAHMHYVLVGGMFFPLIAGFYYWLPLVSGRLSSPTLGRWAFWLTFVGFNMTFLLMHLTGLLGMPRRVYTYESGLGWDWLNLISSIGGFVTAVGIAMIVLDVVLHFRFGKRAGFNPWRSDSLEWSMSTPPKNYNFLNQPAVSERNPLWRDVDDQGMPPPASLQTSREDCGVRETLGTDTVKGQISEIVHLPSNSWHPLQAGISLAVLCLSLLIKVYPLALLATVVSLFILFHWSWHNGAHPMAAPVMDDEPRNPPWHSRTLSGPGLWGLSTALLSNGTFFASLLFGWLYLWTVGPNWSAPETPPIGWAPMLVSGILLTLAVFYFHRCASKLRRGDAGFLQGRILVAALLGLLHTALLAWILFAGDLRPGELAHDALLAVMLYYLLVHSGTAVVMTFLQAWRVKLGYVGLGLPYEPVVVGLFWHYTLAVFWLSFAAFIFLPFTGAMG